VDRNGDPTNGGARKKKRKKKKKKKRERKKEDARSRRSRRDIFGEAISSIPILRSPRVDANYHN